MAHTDEQKTLAITAYEVCRTNALEAARFCKNHYGFSVSHDQITRWYRGEQIDSSVRENANAVKSALADRCEEFAQKALDAMLENLENAKLSEQATAFGIAVDKMLRLRGEPDFVREDRMGEREAQVELTKLLLQYSNDRDEPSTDT